MSAKSLLKKAQERLHAIGLKYWEHIPCNEIQTILDEIGMGKDLETQEPVMNGFFCGKDSRITCQISPKNNFVLYWHKFETGRYEITAYIS